ncbi:MAG TPA: type II toxin-antitoxin system ParD family antitoxin [Acidobacteriaceae bacterium]|nr:type II toxin-antitoxin system ParD family antitoxin [Acidobacteriaceae bacterium]
MAASQKRTFSLPTAQTTYIDKLVKSGGYASGSEVVRAGLRALKERDEAMEHWLREEVVPVCEELDADPSQVIPDEQLAETILAEHKKHMRKTA